MNLLDRTIGYFAPTAGLKRTIARRRMQWIDTQQKKWKARERSFDAVSGDRLRYDFLSTSASADSAIKDGSKPVRQHVRQLEYNQSFVSGPVQRIRNNVVGKGIRFQSRVLADDQMAGPMGITQPFADQFNKQAEKLFKRWNKQADMRLLASFYEMQSLIEGALVRDGEVLVIGRSSNRRGRMIPYCQEVLEIDRLQTPMSEIRNASIRQGIKFDAEGAPESYYVLRNHPGDALTGFKDSDFEEIPAYYPNGSKKVIYLFNPLRPEQTRGFSQFASALKDIQDLDRYREAEIFAALEDACLTAVITTEAAGAFGEARATGSIPGENGDSGRRTHDFGPGETWYMQPGESVTMHSPTRGNNSLDQFTNQLLRGPANALDIPPEILTQNWAGMNYSNARTVLLQFYLSCMIRQSYLVEHLCAATWECVLADLISTGQLTAPRYLERKEDYQASAWIAPGWQWVDPVKEATGKKIELENNFETLSDLLASKGKDFEETVEARAQEIRKMKELEAKYEIKFPTGAASGGGGNGGGGGPSNDQADQDGSEEAAAEEKAILTVVK